VWRPPRRLRIRCLRGSSVVRWEHLTKELTLPQRIAAGGRHQQTVELPHLPGMACVVAQPEHLLVIGPLELLRRRVELLE
jgi:hypothetical protein